jgi:hypothetical protein
VAINTLDAIVNVIRINLGIVNKKMRLIKFLLDRWRRNKVRRLYKGNCVVCNQPVYGIYPWWTSNPTVYHDAKPIHSGECWRVAFEADIEEQDRKFGRYIDYED